MNDIISLADRRELKEIELKSEQFAARLFQMISARTGTPNIGIDSDAYRRVKAIIREAELESRERDRKGVPPPPSPRTPKEAKAQATEMARIFCLHGNFASDCFKKARSVFLKIALEKLEQQKGGCHD